MRLFVALEISHEIREAVAGLIRELRQLDESWKWTRAENLHVTLKFLGEIPTEKLDGIKEALRGVHTDFPIALKFAGLGFFPNERRPHVLWIGMDAPPSLPELAANIDHTVAGICMREERGFTAHLTVARCKDGRISPRLREALAKYADQEFGTMEVSTFHLIESKLKSTGAEYTTLESFAGTRER